MAVKDSLFGPEKFRQLQLLTLSEQQRVQQLREQQAQLQRTVLLLALGVFLLLALLLWRNIHHRQKAYTLLQKQKQETDQQRIKAEQTLEELKATQAQLVQREKMASLGELTAGIAHEIQNPLNFVNNFSALNKELLSEMREAIETGNLAEVKAIAGDLENNEEKIAHHGRRADSIVRGMLQHSRADTGEKQATNINQLTDEYLRLSYQGQRAKDKSFNVTLETHFDAGVGTVSVVPQDLGRVLLNLLNNAFYAVQQKRAQTNGTYDPVISVTTKRERNHIVIAVKDNGTGMSQQVANKVFQPFFTTKPTGEGTGLGLSLGYDIITKGHGGELRVESKEGEGSAFLIQLPSNASTAATNFTQNKKEAQ